MKALIKRVFRISDNNIKELDGIRGIAVLLVFCYHILNVLSIRKACVGKFNIVPYMMWGHLGVNIFYTLSGFLLFIPFAKAYYNGNTASVKEYALKRALRILPAFYFFILIYVFCVNPELISASGLKSIVGNMLFLQNYSIFGIKTFNDTAWTLAIEVQFYVLLPYVYKFFVDNKGKKSIFISIFIVLVYRLVITWILKPDMINYNRAYYVAAEYNILGCFDNFAIGMIIGNLYLRNKMDLNNDCLKGLMQVCKNILIMSPIILILLMNNYYNWNYENSLFNNVFFSFFFDISFYICIASVFMIILFTKSNLNKILKNSILVFIGNISYSIYIWHLFLQQRLANIPFVIYSKSLGVKYLKLMLVSIIFIIPFSALMFILVERPFIDLSKKLFRTIRN